MRLVVLLLVLVGAVAHAATVGVHCAPSAEAAVARMLANHADEAVSLTEGFRVAEVRVDRLHARSYAFVASCSEPARPWVSVLLPGGVNASVASAVLVRAGEKVVVVSATGESKLELEAVAAASGRAGQEIAVRLSRALFAEGGAPVEWKARVVAQGRVEVVR